KAFATALTRFKMDAATTVYVGDNPRVDVAGAKAAGMLTAWADLENSRFPDDVEPPDLVIHRLPELPELIDQPPSTAG
ncbi:MAG: HAD family hydrolase, partial [Candidatus Eremiobacteraeota bacterium]|nr:HAD family hydrolase [Candidatus Eremiobacteraeota bacterium]